MGATRIGLRKAWFQVHKWIGIVLAIVFIPLCLTGSLLVWDAPLDRLLHPARHAASAPVRLPMAAYLAAAQRVLPPAGHVAMLSMGGDAPVVVTALDPQPRHARPGPPARTAVWLDPANARVIDKGSTNAGFLRWVHIFHGSLQIPGVGRAIVGWLGVAMVLSCVSGLWLWWPTVGRWSKGLRWRRQRALDGNLHHLVGFWIALPLAVLAFTGVLIAFPVLTGGGGMGDRMRRMTAAPTPATRLAPQQVLAAAQGLGGAPGRVSIAWPSARQPAWQVAFGSDGPSATLVSVDDATGVATPARRGSGASLYRRIHDGQGLGFVWQFVIVLGGIAPAILGVTGILMWLRTRRWRGAAADRARGRREQVTAG